MKTQRRRSIAARLKVPRDPLLAFLLPVFVCLAAGAVISLAGSSTSVAAARVEVDPAGESGGAAQASPSPNTSRQTVATQLEVIKSERVLQLAAQKLKLPSIEDLEESVSARQLNGTNVIEIQATRPGTAEAVRWANAVTDSFVDFRRASAISNAVSAGQLIERAIANAQSQITALDAQISKNPPNVASLRQQHAALGAQVRSLQTQLRNLPQAETVVKGDVTILARARTPRAAAQPKPLRNMGLAAVAGMIIGAPLALVARKRRGPKYTHEETDESEQWESRARTPEGLDGDEAPDTVRTEARAGMGGLAGRTAPADSGASIGGSLTVPDQRLSEEFSSFLVHLNRSLEAYNRHILSEIAARQGETEAKLSQAVHSMGSQIHGGVNQSFEAYSRHILGEIAARQSAMEAKLSEAVQAMGTQIHGGVNQSLEAYARHIAGERGIMQNGNDPGLSEAIQKSLETYSRDILSEIAARQEGTAQQLAGAMETMNSRVSTEVGQYLQAHATHLLLEIGSRQEGLASDLQSLAERLETTAPGHTNRLFGLLKQMNVQMHGLQDRFSGDLQALRDSVLERANAGQAENRQVLTQKEQESFQRLTKAAMQMAQGMQQLRSEISEKLSHQSGLLEGVSEDVKGSNLVRYLEERLDRIERESFDRLTKVAGELSQGLHELREGVSQNASLQGETVKKMLESIGSVEAKLLGGNGLAGRMGGLFEWVGGQIKAVDARLVSAVEQINEGVKDGVQSNRAELAERLSGVDAEVSERLGRVAVRLSHSLEALRNEIVQKSAIQQETLASVVDSLERRDGAEASEMARRLSALLEDFGRQMQAAEAMTARGLSEVKAEILNRARTAEAQMSEQLTRVNSAIGRRVEDIIAEANEKLKDASSKSTKRLTAQLGEITRRLEAVENQVEDQTSAVAKRLSLRLKAIERSLSDLSGDSEQAASEEDSQG